ncbi:hypothetical protein C6P40_001499 [Pichia californica]|uniref:Pseudouridine synthase RsuA/RluA-like domain-containing protein n=1 Tax=Pichia californica TaxID=460514 RepID=A0A9P7BFP1_9ASCO|nr:hypothetical protein C6P42_003004 [[Candida] californica]KAG0690767.1 hypothetical protein C6P40_001499 [[Candida] californica]
MIRQYTKLVRYQSTSVPQRLFNIAETADKIRDETKLKIPNDITKISPEPNPPIFKSKNGYQEVTPYTKIQYSNVDKVKKKKPINVIRFFESSFLGKNIDFFKRQIAEGNLWLLRAPDNAPPLSKKIFLKDGYSSYEIIKGPGLFDEVLRSTDVIVNHACIHELKVPDLADNNKKLPFGNLEIIYEDKRLIVVNKPPGLPIHPSGMAYRFNSLLYLLTVRENQIKGKETEIDEESRDFKHAVYSCHRIDKDTSGIVIFAKNTNKAIEMNKIIEYKKFITKKYIALVHGNFGKKIKTSKHPVVEVDLAKRYENGGIGKKIQYGKSQFKPIHYDPNSDTTLIECTILTGRRHQIRQHLRNINVHIVNDPLYGINGILKDPMHHFPEKQLFLKLRREYELQLEKRIQNWEKESICTNCGHITYRDPNESKNNYMRLHSFEYTYQTDVNGKPEWSFKTKLPQWAKDVLPADKVTMLESESELKNE